MRSISTADKNNILSLLSHGLSTRKIASQTGISKSKVALVAQEAGPNKENNPGGRPKKLSPHDQRAVSSLMQPGKASNATQATRHMNNILSDPVSTQTIRNTLHNDNYKAYTKPKRPKLTVAQKRARLKFAQKYEHWTVEDWKRVIWSDECKINIYGSDGQQYVWKKREEDFRKEDIKETVKFGGGKIMLWGCMRWNGPGILCEVQGTMDAKQYVDILGSGLLESLEKLEVSAENIYFQQDGDGKHTSNLAWSWFDDHGIGLLGPWPSQSPDLNPLEHLWYLLKGELRSRRGGLRVSMNCGTDGPLNLRRVIQ